MITIHAKIYPGKFIGCKETAEKFFTILEQHGFAPDKIAFYEPIREPYTIERAVAMWTESRNYKTHIAGGMLGKNKKPNFSFMVHWSKGEKVRPNTITFFIAKTAFKANKETIERLYQEIFNLVEGVYGYITHETPENRQHVPGSIESRMPGVFYCNYFGQPYVDFFGKEKILSGPWTKTEVLGSGIIVTHLSDDPSNKEIVDSDELEMKAQHHLGIGSFGELKRHGEDMYDKQARRVPKLELPTIRVPINNQ